MAWPNDTVLEFLDLYRAEPILWDSKHPSHKNRSEVNGAWERIKNNFSIECTVVDLKKKKESLMTSFRSYMNKKRKCPDLRPSWFAFSQMESFLGGKYECDSTHHIDTEYQTPSYSTNQVNDPLHIQSVNMSNSSTPDRQCNLKRSKLTYTRQNIQRSSPHCRKSEKDDTGDDSDECDLYCQLLAKKLKKLNEHQRDVVMHEIDNLIFRARMESAQVSYTESSSPVPRKIRSPVFIVSASGDTQYNEENTQFEANSLNN